MAKRDALDDGQDETTGSENSKPAKVERIPTLEELRKAPKEFPAEGRGPGGRQWVLCAGDDGPKVRRTRQGDESRPICPICSNDELAVLTGATSSPTAGSTATTRYKCPTCSFSTQILRPGVAESLRRRSGSAETFVARP